MPEVSVSISGRAIGKEVRVVLGMSKENTRSDPADQVECKAAVREH